MNEKDIVIMHGGKEHDIDDPCKTCDETKKEFSIFIQGLEMGRIEERGRIKKLITDELAIAHKEGAPTSRLTSLYMKLKDDE